MIKIADDHTEEHLEDTQNDGQFHLERVEEENLILGQLPDL